MTEPDVVKLAELFLVPSSVLLGALGIASTEPLKTTVSLLGFAIAAIWAVCNGDAVSVPQAISTRELLIAWLPAGFMACWASCVVVHAKLWWHESKSRQS